MLQSIAMRDSNKMLHTGNARSKNQTEVMNQIITDGVCPFCREHFETYHPHPIILETEHWFVTQNAWPYEHTKHHFLLVCKPHVEVPEDIPTDAWANLQSVIAKIKSDYDLQSASFMMRSGEPKFTGATVTHLHAHLIVAESSKTPVLARVG